MNRIQAKLKVTFPGIYEELAYYKDYLSYLNNKNKKDEQLRQTIAQIYKKKIGTEMDFNNPKRYTQKIQWIKLYDNDPSKPMLADKVAVRAWVEEKIGKEYLIPVIGVYESFEEIDFSQLPESFVIKMNHGSGWNIIVRDKKNINLRKIRKKINRWLNLDFGYFGEGLQIFYSSIKPKIIIEKYVEDHNGKLNDYKFLCFNGECKYFWIDFDRAVDHRRNVYDLNWELQPWTQGHSNYDGIVEKPENFNDMVRVANILCKGFKHVRVDLYNVDGKIFFGEMTFTNASGNEKIVPDEYDYKLGELLDLTAAQQEFSFL